MFFALMKPFSFRRSHLFAVSLSVCYTGVIFRKLFPVPLHPRILVEYRFLKYDVVILWMSTLSVITFSFLFLMFLVWVFSLSFHWVEYGFVYLSEFRKEPTYCFIDSFREFSIDEYWIFKRYLRNCWHPLSSAKFKSKWVWDTILYPSEWLRSIGLRTAYFGKDVSLEDHSFTAGGMMWI